jgi:hypothetical protein
MKMNAAFRTLLAAALLAAATGCHTDQTRRAQDYERFLKDTLGTVAPEGQAASSHPVH